MKKYFKFLTFTLIITLIGCSQDDKIESDTENITVKLTSTTVQAEDYDTQSGVQTVNNSKVGYINNNDWIRFDDFDYDGATSVSVQAASSRSGGTIEFRTGSPTGGDLLGTVSVSNTGGWNNMQTFTGSIDDNSSNSDLYLVFKGGSGYLLDIDSFQFGQDSAPISIAPERQPQLIGRTFRLENTGSELWARITATGDLKNLEMTPQSSTGDWPRWEVEEVNDGGDYYYRFKNVASNRRFRPVSETDDNVQTGRTSWTGSWTHWIVSNQGNGNYVLKNRRTNTYLSAGNNNDGALVKHVDELDGNKTLWKFQPITATPPPPPPPTGDTPYDVLGLDDWKITLPKSDDGDNIADEVYRTASNNDVPSDGSLTDYEDEFFYTSNDGVIFECPALFNLPKTSANTSGTRTELREMPDNDDEDGWSASGSTVREMEFSARVLQTSSTRKVAFAQIHDFGEPNWDDLIRIQIESDDANAGVGDFGRIYIMGDMAEGLSSENVPTQPSNQRTIIDNYRLGDWMDIRVTFNNNTIRIYVDNVEVQEYTGATSDSNYFKAGAYNQSMNSSSSGTSIVEFRSLTVTENF